MSSSVIQGHCNCEAIRITLNLPSDLSTVYCHCSSCRRQSGASGTYIVIVSESDVKIDGQLKLYNDNKTDSGTPLERLFCAECGCPIISRSSMMPEKVVVKMGLFEEEDIPKVSAEWYIKNRAQWAGVVSGADQHKTVPGA